MNVGIVVAVDGNGTVELRVDAGSAEARRELGVAAWSVLELLALGGAVDDAGRWMTYSNARDLAHSLGIGKDRAAAALADLRRAGLIAAHVERDQRSARFARSRYEVRIPVSHDTDTALPATIDEPVQPLPYRDSFATRTRDRRHPQPVRPTLMITTRHPHDSTTAPDDAPPIRDSPTSHRIPPSNHHPKFVAHRCIVDAGHGPAGCVDRLGAAVLSVSKLGAGQEGYYLDSVAQGVEDYYLGHGETPGRWMGSASGLLGLEGQVDAPDLRAVLEGRSPVDGTRLIQARKDRVPGFDLTFSAPKSVSVLFGLGDPDTVRAVRCRARPVRRRRARLARTRSLHLPTRERRRRAHRW